AGFWGSAGQAAYGAANAGLVGLARERRAEHRAATVIEWGPWAGGGMVGNDDAVQLRRRGIEPMQAEDALRNMESVLSNERLATAIVSVDWSRFAPAFAFSRPRPILQSIPAAARALAESASTPKEETTDTTEHIRALPSSERRSAVMEFLQREILAVLGKEEPTESLDPRAGFMDLGLDSLMAIELRQRIKLSTGIVAPASVMFDHPNLESMSEWLAQQIAPEVDEVDAAVRALSCLTSGQWQDDRLQELLRRRGVSSAALSSESDSLSDVLKLVDGLQDQPK
ncbi:MAG: beta-ketoacyl reductase, partial [Myxococcota bacterium]